MSTSIRDRAIKLLGNNVPQHLVASAVGVTDSYISQLLDEPAVREEIALSKAKELEAKVVEKDTIDTIKVQALNMIKARLIYAKSPLEAARVFQILDNAKKIGDASGNNDDKADVVTITLPAAARGSVKIQLNAQNQVIDVEGRSMAPLPSRALPALAKEIKERNAASDVTAKLPAPTVPVTVQDKAIASDKLANLRVQEITTMMDGVALVL